MKSNNKMFFVKIIPLEKLILFFMFAYFFQTVKAQSTPDHIVNRYLEHAKSHYSEMIYLQTNKGIYETGEDLWFKAYQLDARTLNLSEQSQTLYLQMVSESDSVVWQEIYPIENGIASGHVYVDRNLPEGNYFLEAYTRLSFFADSAPMNAVRKIKILENISNITNNLIELTASDDNINISPERSNVSTSSGNIIRFGTYPEGGYLVDGIPSKLAFKGSGNNDYPIMVSGKLYQDGSPITEFSSKHNGMGFISFTPSADKKYEIILDNNESYPLPEILRSGMTMQLTGRDSAFLEFTVTKSPDLADQFVYILGQMRGEVCCVARGRLKDNLKINIPLGEFTQQGIAEFTLFGEDMLPVAERLVYVHPEKKLLITATPDKNTYKTREKISVTIKVTDEQGKPVKTNLGISVFDQLYKNTEDPVNIMTHCYLSSQIPGKIYDPAYYFDNNNPERTDAMDLLLMTQGWRRYVWNTINREQQGATFITDDISGKLDVESRNYKNTEQFIQLSGANEGLYLISTDSNGYFSINSNQMSDLRDGYLYLKPLLPDGFKTNINFYDKFSDINKIRTDKKTLYPLSNPNNTIVIDTFRLLNSGQFNEIILDEVVVTAKLKRPLRDKYMGRLDSLAQINLGPWVCDHGYLEDYIAGYTHMHNSAFFPSVSDTKKHIPVIGETYKIVQYKYEGQGPLGYFAFSVVDFRTVVYRGANFSDEELLKMSNLWRTKGYYGVREFYQEDEIDMQISSPDMRNSLYWNPEVMTDDKGEVTISFYCSDINTTFTGKIEGTDGMGLFGTTDFEFRTLKIPTFDMSDNF